MTTTNNDTTLLVEYLDVCNTAMAAQKDSFPHKQVLALSKLVFGGRNFSLLFYDEDSDLPNACYTVRFSGDQLELVAEGKQNAAFSCKVKRDYLRSVVERRQEYIDHPERLDWEWLKSRLGLGRDSKDESELVSELITRELEWVAPRTSVHEAAMRMRDSNLGALAVLDGGRAIGMLTDRDLALRVIAGGMDPNLTVVEEVMTRDVLCCPSDLTVDAAAAIMQERSVRRLLVLDSGNKSAGMLSLDDLATQLPDKRLAGETLARIAAKSGGSAAAP
ncbi:MAG: CBS domain-containing protein [Acidobacteria bacterium]|nr:CBS domain-containing protein [Acidobacteriota bacterium]